MKNILQKLKLKHMIAIIFALYVIPAFFFVNRGEFLFIILIALLSLSAAIIIHYKDLNKNLNDLFKGKND